MIINEKSIFNVKYVKNNLEKNRTIIIILESMIIYQQKKWKKKLKMIFVNINLNYYADFDLYLF